MNLSHARPHKHDKHPQYYVDSHPYCYYKLSTLEIPVEPNLFVFKHAQMPETNKGMHVWYSNNTSLNGALEAGYSGANDRLEDGIFWKKKLRQYLQFWRDDHGENIFKASGCDAVKGIQASTSAPVGAIDKSYKMWISGIWRRGSLRIDIKGDHDDTFSRRMKRSKEPELSSCLTKKGEKLSVFSGTLCLPTENSK